MGGAPAAGGLARQLQPDREGHARTAEAGAAADAADDDERRGAREYDDAPIATATAMVTTTAVRTTNRGTEAHNKVYGSFLVAAYRRPEFRVDATLSGVTAIAGTTLKGVVTGRYLFGATMNGRPVSWNLTRTASTWAAISGHPQEVRGRTLHVPELLRRRQRRHREPGRDARREGYAHHRSRRADRHSACPTPTRSKVKSRMSRARRSPDARRSSSIPRPGTSAFRRPRHSSISGRASTRR